MVQYGHYNDNNDLDEQEPAASRISPFRLVLGIIMVAIYLAMAFALVFTTLFAHTMPLWVRYFMGAVFFLYGIYRGYRVYKGGK